MPIVRHHDQNSPTPTTRTNRRLVQLFEVELRASITEPEAHPEPEVAKPRRRMSRELDRQVAEFAESGRKDGVTPEQMLVELKSALAAAAPEIPSTHRNAFISLLTGRAINAFFGETGRKKKQQ